MSALTDAEAIVTEKTSPAVRYREGLAGFIRSDDPTVPKVGEYATGSIGGDSYSGLVTAILSVRGRTVVEVTRKGGAVEHVKFYKGKAGAGGAARWRDAGSSYMTYCFGVAIDKWDPSF